MNDNSATNTEEYLASLPDWQATNLKLFRELVRTACPEVTEAMKWGVPTFLHKSKIMFTMAAFKAHTKYNFVLNGALLKDEHGLFNNGLDSKKSRSIDLKQGETIPADRLRALVQASLDAA